MCPLCAYSPCLVCAGKSHAYQCFPQHITCLIPYEPVPAVCLAAAGKPVYMVERERWPTWAGFLLGVCANAWKFGGLAIRKLNWASNALPRGACPSPPYYPPPSRPAFPPADWSSLHFLRQLSPPFILATHQQPNVTVYFLDPEVTNSSTVAAMLGAGLLPVCQVR